MNQPPAPTPCPQCTSPYCGPIACRFSGIQHDRIEPPRASAECFDIGAEISRVTRALYVTDR